MEPVSLAIGIIPLIGAAVTGYKATRRKLKSFRQYARGVQRIREQLIVQQTSFQNESLLFLRLVTDSDLEARGLLRTLNTLEPAIQAHLEDQWKKRLTDSYEACRLLYTDVLTTNNELQKLLEPFEHSDITPQNISEKAHRTKNSLKFAFEEAKCQKLIEGLRVLNSDLAVLRRQNKDLEEPIIHTAARCCVQKKLSRDFGSLGIIRRAVTTLHQSLVTVYSEPHAPPTATQHTAKLFADALVNEGTVLTNMTMSCSCNDPQRDMVPLVVHSQLEWHNTSLPTPPSSDTCDEGSNIAITTKRRKTVHWGDTLQPITSDSSDVLASSKTAVEVTQGPSPQDLQISKSICLDFLRAYKGKSIEKACIGFLDGTEGFRHTFFPSPSAADFNNSHDDFVSLAELLQCHARSYLSIHDQLALARDVVSAVLKFHQTAWTNNEYWTTKDLSFIQKGSDLSKSLQTLHFSVSIDSRTSQEEPDSMEDIETRPNSRPDTVSEALKETMLEYGVRNLTLFGLGVILLQIGRWDVVPDGDIKHVRRLAQEPARLGRRFKDLTLRCLYCDFGKGSSLAKPRLQEAVYDNVICELTDMISAVGLEDDD
ncbi:hypothetical protein HD806DRAFT_494603 [Xylariaceae sp. AK1471]|nr:hypothetical protein HD806DRAFT_494603 [Xylariaceae sp. AK1471]